MPFSTKQDDAKVYIRADKFLQVQIEQFQKSGHFIEHLAIVPSNGWPGTLQDVTILLEELKNRCAMGNAWLVLVSKASAFQASWQPCSTTFGGMLPKGLATTTGRQTGEVSWNLQFFQAGSAPAASEAARMGFVLAATKN
jgi:hypothetical protein